MNALSLPIRRLFPPARMMPLTRGKSAKFAARILAQAGE
jgi:hypothetical protein